MNISRISSVDNSRTSNSPNFGMIYTPKTVKTLKKLVPEFIKKEGFESARLAVGTLKRLGFRKDNLVLHLEHEGGHPYFLSTGVNRVKNKDFKGVIYCVDSPSCIEVASRSKTGFQDYTRTLESDNFVKSAHARIDEYSDVVKKMTFKDKVAQKVETVKDALVDAKEWVQEQLSLEDIVDGKKTKTSLVGWENLKQSVKSAFKEPPFETHEESFLRRELDSLPTKI